MGRDRDALIAHSLSTRHLLQLVEFNESPLLLHLHPAVSEGEQVAHSGGLRTRRHQQPSCAGAKELPLQLLVSDASGGGALTSLPFRIETTESERLTVDHVVNAADGTRSPCE